MMKDSARVFFPGLNGLRFFAAFAVIFTHVELMKKLLHHASHWIIVDERVRFLPVQEVLTKNLSWLSPIIANAGPLGVVCFFVLSGFLITYLLLREKEVHGVIDIRKFYLRRIYRIWPLYYLVVILGFFILPQFDWFRVPVQQRFLEPVFWEHFALAFFMLPNLAFSLFIAPPNIGQIWSIGVEEQFYLIWPWFLQNSKKLLRTICLFIGLFMVVKLAALLLDNYTDNRLFEVLRKFFAMSRLESMALGAFGAYLVFSNRQRALRALYHPVTQVISYLLIPALIYFTPVILWNVIHLAYSVIFLIVILNVACNPKSILKLENPIFDFLGRISYGLYMYHIMCIVFVIHMYDEWLGFGRDLSAWENLLVYSTSVALTIAVSTLSYYFFEKPFMRRKTKLAMIVSGDDARH